jgi:hypothetical protein
MGSLKIAEPEVISHDSDFGQTVALAKQTTFSTAHHPPEFGTRAHPRTAEKFGNTPQ